MATDRRTLEGADTGPASTAARGGRPDDTGTAGRQVLPRPDQPFARLAFVGDLMLGRGVDAVTGERSPRDFWGDVAPVLRDVDTVIGNLECPITDTAQRWRRSLKSFRFRARPAAVDILKAGNIGALCLANNHILDCEVQGLVDTMGHLDSAGIAHAGAGKNLRDAARPALFRSGQATVGMVALTNTMPRFAAGPRAAGTYFFRIGADDLALGALRELEQELRRAGADITVASVHWGPNLRPWPPARYRRFARAAIDLGFDVFHGHSAHILQGIEFRRGGLILYDTGDCLDDYWVFPGIRIDRSAVFVVEFGAHGVRGLRIVPLLLSRTRTRRARGSEARAIIRRLLKLSGPLAAAEPEPAAALDFSLSPAVTGCRGVGRWIPEAGR